MMTMIETYSFGNWLKQRRKQLRLTQQEVSTAVFCSTAMIKKIEADERHLLIRGWLLMRGGIGKRPFPFLPSLSIIEERMW